MTDDPGRRLKVLLSAYACEPGRGSEPGVGWAWAVSLAEHVDVTVITRANNRQVIEAWTSAQDGDCNIRFIYYDPPRFLVALKGKCVPVALFYLAWQAGVGRMIRRMKEHFDLVHHVTFNTMLLPGLLWRLRIPVVLGPLGGTSRVRSEYRGLFGWFDIKERVREFLIRNWRLLPWIRRSFDDAQAILCANSDSLEVIGSLYRGKTRLMLETGVFPENLSEPVLPKASGEHPMRLIWIGTMEPWKAPTMAIRGFAKAVQALKHGPGCVLDMVGDGGRREESEELVDQLGLRALVRFHGWIGRDKVQEMISASSALLFSSVKDTSGNVVLEAMAHGLPVVCLDHQGVADITSDETAIRVEPGTIDATEDGFATAIIKLATDPAMGRRMGKAGYARVVERYSWEQRASEMVAIYQEACDGFATRAT